MLNQSSRSAILGDWLGGWVTDCAICSGSLYLSLTYSAAHRMTQGDPWVTKDDPWVTRDDPRATKDDPRVMQDDLRVTQDDLRAIQDDPLVT